MRGISNMAKTPKIKYEGRLRLRELRPMGQIEFASLMGVSQSVVSRWETGDKEPSAGELVRMSRVIGCTVDALLGLHGVSDERERALKRFYEILVAAKKELGGTLTYVNVASVIKNVWNDDSGV